MKASTAHVIGCCVFSVSIIALAGFLCWQWNSAKPLFLLLTIGWGYSETALKLIEAEGKNQ